MATHKKLAFTAMKMAYSPYSKFTVGACLETSDGKTYLGCNVENASYSATLCAERVAIFKAVSEGHKKFKKIYLCSSSKDVITPCGNCLQVMAEFFTPKTEVICMNSNGKKEVVYKFKDLLPAAFTKTDLK